MNKYEAPSITEIGSIAGITKIIGDRDLNDQIFGAPIPGVPSPGDGSINFGVAP
jgi:hypothetical protein